MLGILGYLDLPTLGIVTQRPHKEIQFIMALFALTIVVVADDQKQRYLFASLQEVAEELFMLTDEKRPRIN